jgi:hypothetical protein
MTLHTRFLTLPWRDTIKDRASIHDRPKDIEARADIGHWEGDLIICKRTRPMLVLHERKSRTTLAARLTGKTAAETISVMLAVFGGINPTLRKSITFDNDTAFFRPAHPAPDHALYGNLVLRRLRLLAERRRRKRQWSITTLAAVPHRHRLSDDEIEELAFALASGIGLPCGFLRWIWLRKALLIICSLFFAER